MSKDFLFGAVVIGVVAIGGYMLFFGPDSAVPVENGVQTQDTTQQPMVPVDQNTDTSSQVSVSSGDVSQKPQVSTPVQTPFGGITMAEVAKHSSTNDCWMVVSGKVYDMTSYLPQHPGGQKAIARECGGDATTAFMQEKKHSEVDAMGQLAAFHKGNVQ